MGTLNQFGYQTTTLSEKKTNLQNIFKSAFGDDINLNDYSPQGMIINFLALLLDQDDKIGLNIYQSLDYKNASGNMLSLIAITKGQPRRDGTKAVITAKFTSSSTGYTILANSEFSLTSDSNIIFKILNDTPITTNQQIISLEATKKQRTNAIITNKLTSISNYPLLTDIEIVTITDGTDIESDKELITKLSNNDIKIGSNDYNAISAKLSLVEGVTRRRIFDNDSSSTVNSVPAHTIMVQVVGGDNTAIAQCILDNKATGTPTYGNTTVNILIDSDGYSRTINFNRPTEKTVYLKLTLEKRNNIAVDTSRFNEFKKESSDYINSLLIGNNVSYTALFGIWATGNYNINKLELSLDDITYVETDLTIAFTEYASLSDLDHIIINVI